MKARHIKRLRKQLRAFEVQEKDYRGYYWDSNPWCTVMARSSEEAALRFFKRTMPIAYRQNPEAWKCLEIISDIRVREASKRHSRFEIFYHW